ncbi:MAG: GtrA family protein [Chloroflexi bacterium]|nr:GtrA family protein [Chloroflexota bacterium]
MTRILSLPLVSHLLQRTGIPPREVSRFIKFGLVGTVGAVVDFTILNLLIQLAGWDKFNANLVSVSCAVVSNFIWNRLWTFPESRQRKMHTQLTSFVIVNLIGLIINQFVFITLDTLVFEPLLGPMGYNLAKACAIMVVLFWNFGVNRLVTYRGL